MLFCFFAQEFPVPAQIPSHESALFFFLFAGGIAFLLWCCLTIVTILATLRRKPSIEAEFATKLDLKQTEDSTQARLNDLRAEFHREIGKIEGTTQIIFNKIDSLAISVTRSMGDLQRDIGRLEGTVK